MEELENNNINFDDDFEEIDEDSKEHSLIEEIDDESINMNMREHFPMDENI